MKETFRDTFELYQDEYIITAEHITSKDYQIKYKGKIINDVIAVIRKRIK